MAHAELGKLFDLPVILTTSADHGPNGPLPKEMLELYPDAPLIRRQGEVKYITTLSSEKIAAENRQRLGQSRFPRRC